MSILSAKVSQVPIGHSQIEGLLGSDGRFYIAVPQIAEQIQFPIKHAARDIKAMLGNDSLFPIVKVKTSLNPKAVNAIPIECFEKVLVELTVKGNVQATVMLRALAGLSLHQLFCDAFDITFEKEDRQQWLKERMEATKLYKEASDCVAAWMASRSTSAPDYVYYANLGDAFNLCLFGKTSKQIREELEVKGLIRDSFGENALKAIVHLETTAVHLWKQDPTVSPDKCVKRSADFLGLKPINYQE